MKKIACIGSITTDILVRPADSVPTPGTLRAVEGVEMHVGGCASNAAIDIAKLGFSSAILCRVGKDNFGRFVKNTCTECGVDIRGVVESESSVTTGSVVCISSTGERSFLYNPGSTADMVVDDINMDVIADCDIVFAAGVFLTVKLDGKPYAAFMKKCQEMGKFTVMDTAWDFTGTWLPLIEDMLPCLDLFMPSYEEAVMLSGQKDPEKIADFFFDRGVKSVIIKLGKDGALVCETKDNKVTYPTYSEFKPIDTTGAGDSFCAGFLSGLAQGWSYEQSAKFANAVGTHCILAVGASAGIKPAAEILKFMENNKLEEGIK